MPAVRWAPYRVPHVLLGDQQAPCRDTRAVVCPVPGHPCLESVLPAHVVAACAELAPAAPGAAAHRRSVRAAAAPTAAHPAAALIKPKRAGAAS